MQKLSVHDGGSANAEASAVPSFEALGGFDEQQTFEAWLATAEGTRALEDAASEVVLGRVVRLDRGYPLVVTATDTLRAEHAISLVKESDKRGAIGDWVALSVPQTHDKAIIEGILPRKSEFSRWDGSALGGKQVLASNIDLVLIAVPLSKKPLQESSLLRIVKAVVLAYDAGCDAAIILTKQDRKKSYGDQNATVEADVALVKRVVGAHIPVVVTSSVAKRGIEEVRGLIAPHTTAALLGESGAGKSTLLNALVGYDAMETGEVRARDDKGRHTTVSRMMVQVPGAGLVIDAPGLRTLPLVEHDTGLALAFPEITEASASCKFRDCTHRKEPGCAVRALVEAGELDEMRLEVYRALLEEMTRTESNLDPAVKRTRR